MSMQDVASGRFSYRLPASSSPPPPANEPLHPLHRAVGATTAVHQQPQSQQPLEQLEHFPNQPREAPSVIVSSSGPSSLHVPVVSALRLGSGEGRGIPGASPPLSSSPAATTTSAALPAAITGTGHRGGQHPIISLSPLAALQERPQSTLAATSRTVGGGPHHYHHYSNHHNSNSNSSNSSHAGGSPSSGLGLGVRATGSVYDRISTTHLAAYPAAVGASPSRSVSDLGPGQRGPHAYAHALPPPLLPQRLMGAPIGPNPPPLPPAAMGGGGPPARPAARLRLLDAPLIASSSSDTMLPPSTTSTTTAISTGGSSPLALPVEASSSDRFAGSPLNFTRRMRERSPVVAVQPPSMSAEPPEDGLSPANGPRTLAGPSPCDEARTSTVTTAAAGSPLTAARRMRQQQQQRHQSQQPAAYYALPRLMSASPVGGPSRHNSFSVSRCSSALGDDTAVGPSASSPTPPGLIVGGTPGAESAVDPSADRGLRVRLGSFYHIQRPSPAPPPPQQPGAASGTPNGSAHTTNTVTAATSSATSSAAPPTSLLEPLREPSQDHHRRRASDSLLERPTDSSRRGSQLSPAMVPGSGIGDLATLGGILLPPAQLAVAATTSYVTAKTATGAAAVGESLAPPSSSPRRAPSPADTPPHHHQPHISVATTPTSNSSATTSASSLSMGSNFPLSSEDAVTSVGGGADAPWRTAGLGATMARSTSSSRAASTSHRLSNSQSVQSHSQSVSVVDFGLSQTQKVPAMAELPASPVGGGPPSSSHRPTLLPQSTQGGGGGGGSGTIAGGGSGISGGINGVNGSSSRVSAFALMGISNSSLGAYPGDGNTHLLASISNASNPNGSSSHSQSTAAASGMSYGSLSVGDTSLAHIYQYFEGSGNGSSRAATPPTILPHSRLAPAPHGGSHAHAAAAVPTTIVPSSARNGRTTTAAGARSHSPLPRNHSARFSTGTSSPVASRVSSFHSRCPYTIHGRGAMSRSASPVLGASASVGTSAAHAPDPDVNTSSTSHMDGSHSGSVGDESVGRRPSVTFLAHHTPRDGCEGAGGSPPLNASSSATATTPDTNHDASLAVPAAHGPPTALQQLPQRGRLIPRRHMTKSVEDLEGLSEQWDRLSGFHRTATASSTSSARTGQSVQADGTPPPQHLTPGFHKADRHASGGSAAAPTATGGGKGQSPRQHAHSTATTTTSGHVQRTASYALSSMVHPQRAPTTTKVTKSAVWETDDTIDETFVNEYCVGRTLHSRGQNLVFLATSATNSKLYVIKRLPQHTLAPGSGAASLAVSRVNSYAGSVRHGSLPPQPVPLSGSGVLRRDKSKTSPGQQHHDGSLSPRHENSSFASAANTVSRAVTPTGTPTTRAIRVPSDTGMASMASTINRALLRVDGGAHIGGPDGTAGGGGGAAALVHALKADPELWRKCREMAIMKQLQNTHILPLHEAIFDNQHRFMYLVMDYIEGGPILRPCLSDALDQIYEPLPGDKAVRYARQIIMGLTYLHNLSIAHRDIKPENILLDREKDQVKIADFGESDHVSDGHRVLPGPLVQGTPLFYAPEVFGKEPFEAMPLDIWALGVTLYAMCTGKLPFRGTNLAEIGESVTMTEPEYPDTMPSAIKIICRWTLKKDPKERITAAQLWYSCLSPDERKVAATKLSAAKLAQCSVRRARRSRRSSQRRRSRDATNIVADAAAAVARSNLTDQTSPDKVAAQDAAEATSPQRQGTGRRASGKNRRRSDTFAPSDVHDDGRTTAPNIVVTITSPKTESLTAPPLGATATNHPTNEAAATAGAKPLPQPLALQCAPLCDIPHVTSSGTTPASTPSRPVRQSSLDFDGIGGGPLLMPQLLTRAPTAESLVENLQADEDEFGDNASFVGIDPNGTFAGLDDNLAAALLSVQGGNMSFCGSVLDFLQRETAAEPTEDDIAHAVRMRGDASPDHASAYGGTDRRHSAAGSSVVSSLQETHHHSDAEDTSPLCEGAVVKPPHGPAGAHASTTSSTSPDPPAGHTSMPASSSLAAQAPTPPFGPAPTPRHGDDTSPPSVTSHTNTGQSYLLSPPGPNHCPPGGSEMAAFATLDTNAATPLSPAATCMGSGSGGACGASAAETHAFSGTLPHITAGDAAEHEGIGASATTASRIHRIAQPQPIPTAAVAPSAVLAGSMPSPTDDDAAGTSDRSDAGTQVFMGSGNHAGGFIGSNASFSASR